MTTPKGNPWSRRAFMKSAVAGAAASVVSIEAYAISPNCSGQNPLRRSKVMTLHEMSLSDVSQLVRSQKVSPVELTQACLHRIERLNPKLNAFITITADTALNEARAAEQEIRAGRLRGPLHGIPIALKDLVDTAGVRTTAGSELFKDRIPAKDAEVVRRLKAAGAVFLGKLNLHEFAYGGSSAISYFGPVRNPWNTAYSPGGSSGGAAAAVAARLCYGAIGTDTGGSIREPASYCGIVGIKPTYGRVSAAGVIPLSSSLDHVGPMTRTVKDAALMLQAIAGHDPQDPGSSDSPVPDYLATIADSTASLRLGIPRAYFYEGLETEVQTAMEAALVVLKKLTHTQRDCPPLASDGSYASVMDPYTPILRAEAYEYHQKSVAKSPELYQAPTVKRIRAGAEVPKSAYLQYRRELDQIRNTVARFFDNVDLMITPTVPIMPPAIADLADPDTARPIELQMLRNTRVFNALGLPTISVPCGFSKQGLPIAMQISGALGADATVLRLAHAYEQATQWHKRRPSLG